MLALAAHAARPAGGAVRAEPWGLRAVPGPGWDRTGTGTGWARPAENGTRGALPASPPPSAHGHRPFERGRQTARAVAEEPRLAQAAAPSAASDTRVGDPTFDTVFFFLITNFWLLSNYLL